MIPDFVPRNPSSRARGSAFLSRTYGGFTRPQNQFLDHLIDEPRSEVILDPMSGQGYHLCELAWRGANVILGDINPGPQLFAWLRNPQLVRSSAKLQTQAKQMASEALMQHSALGGSVVSDDWLAPDTLIQLQQYSRFLGLNETSNPFSHPERFWSQRRDTIFMIAMAVLAAREICCFRGGDNPTWLRKGGLCRVAGIRDSILRAIDTWALDLQERESVASRHRGKVSIYTADVASSSAPAVPPTLIVTSPPFANRLDYSVMWGPELNVLAGLYSDTQKGVGAVKRHQIGSTVVKHGDHRLANEQLLPEFIRESLERVRNDGGKNCDNYYYPFFLLYFWRLREALIHLTELLERGGRLVVFVRDTVRFDELFEVGRFVREVIRECPLMEDRGEHHVEVIRSHIGLLRQKTARKRVHGLPQREWWLCFNKK